MRRLVASLFGRRDDKNNRRAPHAETTASRTPAYSSINAGYSSTSSSTSFSVLTPDDSQRPHAQPSKWKSVFRNKKGSYSSHALVYPALSSSTAELGITNRNEPHTRSGLRSKSIVDRDEPASDDDEQFLSPPVRPFVPRSRNSDSSNSNGSPRSSRSSLVPTLSSVPESPPPVTPQMFYHMMIIRSLSRNPYASPHPLLLSPTNLTDPDVAIFPCSIHKHSRALPPSLTLRRHLLRLRLLQRAKTHVFTPAEERQALRASSLRRLSSDDQSSGSLIQSRPMPALHLTQQSSEVEAIQLHRIDGSGTSRGLAKWTERPTFEERNVAWFPTSGTPVSSPIFGQPVAELEFSEGLEALAGLHIDNSVAGASAGNLNPYNQLLPSQTARPPQLAQLRLSSYSSSLLDTPSLSPIPSSPSPSTHSFSRPTTLSSRSSSLQRLPSRPKRGVRFAASISSSSSVGSIPGTSVVARGREHSRAESGHGPLVIVHPSTPADELEIDAPHPAPIFPSNNAKGKVPSPPTVVAGQSLLLLQKQQQQRQREHEARERERERELERKKRMQDEVIAARMRRESFKADGGSARAVEQQRQHQQRKPDNRRTSTDPGGGGSIRGSYSSASLSSVAGKRRSGQMWDLGGAYDDSPLSPTDSTFSHLSQSHSRGHTPSMRSDAGGSTSGHSMRRRSLLSGSASVASSIKSNARPDLVKHRTSLPVPPVPSRSPDRAGFSPTTSSSNVGSLSSTPRGLPRRRSLAPGDPSLSLNSFNVGSNLSGNVGGNGNGSIRSTRSQSQNNNNNRDTSNSDTRSLRSAMTSPPPPPVPALPAQFMTAMPMNMNMMGGYPMVQMQGMQAVPMPMQISGMQMQMPMSNGAVNVMPGNHAGMQMPMMFVQPVPVYVLPPTPNGSMSLPQQQQQQGLQAQSVPQQQQWGSQQRQQQQNASGALPTPPPSATRDAQDQQKKLSPSTVGAAVAAAAAGSSRQSRPKPERDSQGGGIGGSGSVSYARSMSTPNVRSANNASASTAGGL